LFFFSLAFISFLIFFFLSSFQLLFLETALRASPARLSTMGRGLADDLAYFLAAAAAGRHASRLLRGDAAAS
jgi:hypothetical protein